MRSFGLHLKQARRALRGEEEKRFNLDQILVQPTGLPGARYRLERKSRQIQGTRHGDQCDSSHILFGFLHAFLLCVSPASDTSHFIMKRTKMIRALTF